MKVGIFLLLLVPLQENLVCAQGADAEHDQVEQAVLGYIENFFINDYDVMQQYLHPRLSKRGLDSYGDLSEDFRKEDLRQLMSSKPPLPRAQQDNQVLDVFVDRYFASAILHTGYPNTRWKEYVHLAKLEGKWVIMDVFWMFDVK